MTTDNPQIQLSLAQLSLTQLSGALADAVERAAGGVITLEVDGIPRSGLAWSDTLVLSSALGIDEESPLTLTLPDGSEAEARLIGTDPRLDVALLELKEGGLTPTERGDPDALRAGELVLTVSRSGRGPRATLGVVASTGPAWTTRSGAVVARWIEVDATLPPGGSGGALVDTAGRLLGLNTPALAPGGTTVPITTLATAAEFLKENGSVRPGLLGVRVRTTALPPDIAAGEGAHQGLLVLGLPRRAPAGRAGIETGDVLLKVDGTPVGSLSQLRAALSTRGGETVTVRRLRAGVIDEVEVTPFARTGGRRRSGRGPWGRMHRRAARRCASRVR